MRDALEAFVESTTPGQPDPPPFPMDLGPAAAAAEAERLVAELDSFARRLSLDCPAVAYGVAKAAGSMLRAVSLDLRHRPRY